jgi:hypothetical protein
LALKLAEWAELPPLFALKRSGKHEERRRIENYVGEFAQKIGGKHEKRHHIGESVVGVRERSAAVRYAQISQMSQ